MQFTKQIVDGDLVPSLVREAVRVAEEERPGAVHLELPEDIAGTATEAHPFPVYPVRRPIAEAKAIDKAVEMIHSASHPLLLIGAGANRKLTQKMWVASRQTLSYKMCDRIKAYDLTLQIRSRLEGMNRLCGCNCRLREFVDEVHIPFVTTMMGKGVVTGMASSNQGSFCRFCVLSSDYLLVKVLNLSSLVCIFCRGPPLVFGMLCIIS